MLATNPVTNILIKARELIADEKNWCQFKLRADDGPNGPRFCAVGALLAVVGGVRPCPIMKGVYIMDQRKRDALYSIVELMVPEFKGSSAWGKLVGINNSLGHAAVMKRFDKGIERSLASPAVEERDQPKVRELEAA